MSTIVLRSVKGTPLSNTEVDTNFSNLNTDKTELGGTYSAGTANGVLFLSSSKVLTSGSALTFDGTNLGIGVAGSAPLSFANATGQKIRFYNVLTGYGIGVESSEFRFVTDNGAVFTWGIGSYASPSEQMRLTSTGLGIGTSSISYGASTRGNLTLGGSESGLLAFQIGGVAKGYVGHFDSNMQIWNDVNSPILFGVNSAEQMRLTSTGLGIGTSSPREKLDVVGNIAAPFQDNQTIQFQYLTGSSYGLGMMADATNRGLKLFTRSADGTGYISFSTGGMTEKMRLDYSGNLGIGTSSPNYKQTINAASYSYTQWVNSNSGTGASDGFRVGLEAGDYANIEVFESWPIVFRIGGSERLRLDSSGNLGLGVTPSAWSSDTKAVQISSVSLSSTGNSAQYMQNGYYNAGYKYVGTGNAVLYEQNKFNGSHNWFTAPSGTAGDAISFTQAMTLDASGRLLVGGTTAVNLLTVAETTSSPGVAFIGNAVNAGNSEYGRIRFGSTASSSAYVNYGGQIASFSGSGIDVSDLRFYTGSGAVSTERARIDSSGNLGLGVTPSAWNSYFKAMQFGSSGGFVTAPSGTQSQLFLGANGYSDSGGTWRYINSAAATRYWHDAGAHKWDIAPSGTAGDAISFTQAMTLTAAGDLLIGQTSANYNVNGTFITATGGVNSVATSATAALFNRKSTDGAIIDFYRDTSNPGSISVTTSATSYNTSSDYRLKNITGPITTSGAYIDSLNPVEGTWKADGSTFVGLIAHEVQESSRTPVATGEKDGEQMQGMDYSSAEIIANLIAEVKSLRARLAAANI